MSRSILEYYKEYAKTAYDRSDKMIVHKDAQAFLNWTGPELVSNAEALLIADASASTPNFRASEFVIGAMYAARTGKPLITDFYPVMPVQEAVVDTPLCVTVDIPPDLDCYQRPSVQGVKISQRLVSLNMYSIFGDVLPNQVMDRIINGVDQIMSRIESKLRKPFKKGSTPAQPELDAAMITANQYLGLFPTTVMELPDGRSYTQYVTDQRAYFFGRVTQVLYGKQFEVSVENGAKVVENITLRDLMQVYPEIVQDLVNGKKAALNFVCPDCSLERSRNGDGPLMHVVGFDGNIYKNVKCITEDDANPPICPLFKKMAHDKFNFLDVPLGTIINAGFTTTGKLTYLAESLAFSRDPQITELVRDYSDPRGTIGLAAKTFVGGIALSPRVYVRVQTNKGERDANGFELDQFISTPEGEQKLQEFVDGLPTFSDGNVYTLNLTTAQINISLAT